MPTTLPEPKNRPTTQRIALISPAHPLRGGIAASSERLAQELQSMGHEVRIFSFSMQYPGFLFPGKTQYSDDAAPSDLDIETCIHSLNPLNWVLSGRKIAKFAPDRIICRYWLPFMSPSLGSVLRFARFFMKQKPHIVGFIDNIIPHEKRIGDRIFGHYFAQACDSFTVMSRSVGEEMAHFGKEKPVRYAPHPVYDQYGALLEKKAARRLLQIPENVPLVLFFGFIRAYKGLDLLMEALAQPSMEQVHLLVAGESYEPWKPYQEAIERCKLTNRVHLFQDFIPTEEVNRFFSAADLVAQPYRTATQSGISQIAYHFGRPMLVTDVGGLAEIVPHGKAGYVVQPNPEAIAEGIHDYFAHQREPAMVAAVLEEKKRFSWRNLADQCL